MICRSLPFLAVLDKSYSPVFPALANCSHIVVAAPCLALFFTHHINSVDLSPKEMNFKVEIVKTLENSFEKTDAR
jgi:hypothetical protein